MIRFDLRTKIAGTVFVLVVVATLLIDLVFIVTLQKALVEDRIRHGRSALASLYHERFFHGDANRGVNADRLRTAAGADALVVVDRRNASVSSGAIDAFGPVLENMAQAAAGQNRSQIRYAGQTWGVFWRQHRFALVSMPLGTSGAGAALALPLDRVYEILRDTQKVAFVYLLINGVLLTLVGVIRLSRVAVKPIERLRKRAETYQDDGSVLFVHERGDSEFSRLSKALNRMLQRISDDREILRGTVRSLEKSNIDLKKAQNDIIQAEKLASVGRLSSGIAHEIGNPIGIVLGYLELLDQTGISERERKEYIQRAQDEINRISTILRQLLDFSRPASGKIEAVSVHSLLNDMLEMVKVQPLMAHVAVDLDLAAQHHRVDADPNQLRQVFLNLVINAADAISLLPDSERGQLTIGSENPPAGVEGEALQPGMLKLRFADNGPGIAEKDLGNVFDPFFTTKDPGKGTGLGLSVCFMIIEKIGGRIFAESGDPDGTVITLYLPLSSGERS